MANTIIKNELSCWVNTVTGEVIEATEVIQQVPNNNRRGFCITYLSAIITMLDCIGNRKMHIIKYILENMDMSANLLLITTDELAKKTNSSRQTVSDTLKELEKAGIITRRIGAIMVNAQLVHRGNEGKERVLMERFFNFNNKPEQLQTDEDCIYENNARAN
jgi:DNA-binding MarR family transcriptional regulator